jgi:hypothetical protein
MEAQAIRRTSAVPVVAAAALLLVAAAIVVLRSEFTPHDGGREGTVGVERAVPSAGEGWGFVLGSSAVQVLRHRPGLTPADIVRSHAFGWEGLTVHEILSNPQYLRTLRLEPQISAVGIIRAEARGT